LPSIYRDRQIFWKIGDQARTINIPVIDRCSDILSVADVRATVAVLGESVSTELMEWLNFIVPDHKVALTSKQGAPDFSQFRSCGSALIVCGESNAGFARFVKNHFPVIGCLPRLAVAGKLTTGQRVRLLRAGYDDIVDTAMDKHEVQARILAVANRYSAAGHYRDQERGSAIGALSAYLANGLDRRELAILQMLTIWAPEVVPIERLCRCWTGRKTITPESLRVIVSRMRPKLLHGFEINNHRQHGYSLQGPMLERAERKHQRRN
jgi:hypothetical protein